MSDSYKCPYCSAEPLWDEGGAFLCGTGLEGAVYVRGDVCKLSVHLRPASVVVIWCGICKDNKAMPSRFICSVCEPGWKERKRLKRLKQKQKEVTK